jgi:hypothetical protein
MQRVIFFKVQNWLGLKPITNIISVIPLSRSWLSGMSRSCRAVSPLYVERVSLMPPHHLRRIGSNPERHFEAFSFRYCPCSKVIQVKVIVLITFSSSSQLSREEKKDILTCDNIQDWPIAS